MTLLCFELRVKGCGITAMIYWEFDHEKSNSINSDIHRPGFFDDGPIGIHRFASFPEPVVLPTNLGGQPCLHS